VVECTYVNSYLTYFTNPATVNKSESQGLWVDMFGKFKNVLKLSELSVAC